MNQQINFSIPQPIIFDGINLESALSSFKAAMENLFEQSRQQGLALKVLSVQVVHDSIAKKERVVCFVIADEILMQLARMTDEQKAEAKVKNLLTAVD